MKPIKDRLYLKKVINSYVLHRVKDGILTIEGDSEFVIGGIEPFYKLSKYNCDELFGIVDVEMVSAFYGSKAKGNVDFKLGSAQGFEDGFNDAMELNKDKLFTKDNVLTIVNHVISTLVKFEGFDQKYLFPEEIYKEVTWKEKQILQPTEIEVEIEEFEYIDGKNTAVDYMLDSEGCIILKKI
jgi:hypothetical protein